MTGDDRIPIGEVYRGISIHADQPPERVAIVKRAIDAVHAIADGGGLWAALMDPGLAPEARSLAGARLIATFGSGSDREMRPKGIDLQMAEAIIAELGSARWRCPVFYGSLLEGAAGRVKRDRPLVDAD